MKFFEHKNADKNEKGSARPSTLIAVGLTALAALAVGPRSHDAPKPIPEPESYTDLAQESAQEAYDPVKDELVIDGIKIKPGNPERNSASEAVLGDPAVKEFMQQHPDETAAVESSALALPSSETGEYAVVKRDIDADGDTDAVAVPKQ
jgi:hypothetical protein